MYFVSGSWEFSLYYAEFQRLMVILEYNSKVKKATLDWGLSGELHWSMVYQAKAPEDFHKFMELCMKLDYRIQVHASLNKRPTISSTL
jgi:hypothetical protein